MLTQSGTRQMREIYLFNNFTVQIIEKLGSISVFILLFKQKAIEHNLSCFNTYTGLLERPSLSPGIPEITFKIGVIGKAGSGKTKTICFLSGKLTTFPSYIETLGIHVKNIYWPAQIQGKISLFKLQFWESGESCSKRYNYISSVRSSEIT